MQRKYRFLVTAGNTHEAIDRVREWSNIFTGRTGLELALALLDAGDVTLLTSNLQHAEQYDGFYGKAGMLGVETFRTHAQLAALLGEQLQLGGIDAVAMSAAVSDYKPAGAYRILAREVVNGHERWIVEDAQAGKIKSSFEQIAILGARTEKLVDKFRREWGFRGVLVKFKLEVEISEEQLVAIAQESRRHSGAELIVANTLEMVQAAAPAAWILGEAQPERISRANLPARLRALLCQLLSARPAQP